MLAADRIAARESGLDRILRFSVRKYLCGSPGSCVYYCVWLAPRAKWVATMARCGVEPVRAIGRVCSGVPAMLAKTMAMMVFITVLAPAVGIALFVLLQSI